MQTQKIIFSRKMALKFESRLLLHGQVFSKWALDSKLEHIVAVYDVFCFRKGQRDLQPRNFFSDFTPCIPLSIVLDSRILKIRQLRRS